MYETASTRQFLKGRTECIRSCSVDSAAFVHGMCSSGATIQQKFELLKAASQAHTKYTIEAMSGKGIDRHLLGLKVAYSLPGDKMERHPLFSHPAMLESTRFRLSTSSLSSGSNYNGTGFGAVEPDGYGINYCVGGDVIKFGVESKRACNATDTGKFIAELSKTLQEMANLCQAASQAKL